MNTCYPPKQDVESSDTESEDYDDELKKVQYRKTVGTAALTGTVQGATKATGQQEEATSTATLNDVAEAALLQITAHISDSDSGSNSVSLLNSADSQSVQHKKASSERTNRLMNRLNSVVISPPPKKKIQRGRRVLPTLRNKNTAASDVEDAKGTSELKDRIVCSKFDTVTKHVQEMQFATTIQNDFDRKTSPKVQHFMVTYDKLVQKPHFLSNKKSRVPKSIFLSRNIST